MKHWISPLSIILILLFYLQYRKLVFCYFSNKWHDADFNQSSLLSQIPATATATQILSGKTAWVNGTKITGSMTDRGTGTKTISPGGSYTISSGYYNGNGKVTCSACYFSNHKEWASNDYTSNYDSSFKLASGTYRFVAFASAGTGCSANDSVTLYVNGNQKAVTGNCSVQQDEGAQWTIESSRSYVNTTYQLDMLRHNKSITMKTLDSICGRLNLSVSEVLEYIPDKK